MSDTYHLIFRLAREDEAGIIHALYRQAAGREFCVWNQEYPGMSEITHDTETGNLFVLEKDGRVIGAISVVPENELDDLLCWNHKEDANEIARVVIHPDDQGKGYSGIMLENTLEELTSRGCRAVHLSVADENIPAQKTYQRLGFVMSGESDMYGHHFFLYEKAL